jgi:HAD superfamily hydrolase (TIGR01509 family)
MQIDAIVFDIDGTLVDSNDLHTACWVEAFAQFGIDVPWETIRRQIGKGGDLLVPDTLGAREMRKFGEQLKEDRSALWKEKYIDRVRPFPGAADAVRAIHSDGVTIALASSSNDDEVEHYVELLGLKGVLDASTSKADARFSKPSPEIFEAALERSGADRARTVVVGDTPYDILAAHRLALPVVAVLCGGFTPDSLSKAEFLYDDVASLPSRLGDVRAWFEA